MSFRRWFPDGVKKFLWCFFRLVVVLFWRFCSKLWWPSCGGGGSSSDADCDSACILHSAIWRHLVGFVACPQSVPSSLMVLLSIAFSLKACDGHALVFSFLCFSIIKTSIFLPYSFSIFTVIIEIVLLLFEFVLVCQI